MSSYTDKVLNLLYGGAKIKIDFPSAETRACFRSRIYANKKNQDLALTLLLEQPRKTLKTQQLAEIEGRFPTVFWMEDKELEFSFELLEESETFRNGPEREIPESFEDSLRARGLSILEGGKAGGSKEDGK